uniref:oleoyl-[acyl-carrier-protein] hydrolase n=1 Tax=Oryctolagus cuniculus TaxID=9986 RepID=G1TM16_RABIT
MERREQAGRTRNKRVLNCIYQNPNAIFKLICFPWAGGGSTYFAKWGQKIHDSLEVHSVRLAGRESRFEEPFANDMYQIVDEIVCVLLPIIQDKPFAFFGHRYSKVGSFMTALYLKENHKLEPMHFFVSSTTPPHVSNFVFLEAGWWRDENGGGDKNQAAIFHLADPGPQGMMTGILLAIENPSSPFLSRSLLFSEMYFNCSWILACTVLVPLGCQWPWCFSCPCWLAGHIINF